MTDQSPIEPSTNDTEIPLAIELPWLGLLRTRFCVYHQ